MTARSNTFGTYNMERGSILALVWLLVHVINALLLLHLPCCRMAERDGTFHLVNNVQHYLYRHPALKEWSPVELTMAFKFEKARTKAAKLLLVQPPHPLFESHGHQPRTTIVLAQFISNFPAKPDEDSDDIYKEEYARVILANFFPFKDVVLVGNTLWDKLGDWRRRKPRGRLDDLALRMVDNAAMVSLK